MTGAQLANRTLDNHTTMIGDQPNSQFHIVVMFSTTMTMFHIIHNLLSILNTSVM